LGRLGENPIADGGEVGARGGLMAQASTDIGEAFAGFHCEREAFALFFDDARGDEFGVV